VDVEKGGGLVLVLMAWRVVWVGWGQPVSSPPGEAPGPLLHPTAPLVPTGCRTHLPRCGRHHSSGRWGRKRPNGYDYPIRLATFIIGQWPVDALPRPI